MEEMLKMTLLAAAVAAVSEGTGTFVTERMKLVRHGFAAPLGISVLFCLLEIAFLPCLLGHAGMTYAAGALLCVGAAGIVMAVLAVRKSTENIAWHEVGAVWLSVLLFLIIRHLLHGLSDTGGEYALVESGRAFSSLQGYSVMASLLALHFGMKNTVTFLGILFHLIYAEVSLNIIRLFRLRNRWFAFTLVCYALFMTSFNSWQIAECYAGWLWRPVFAALMLYQTGSWLTRKQEYEKYLLMFYAGAGMFTASGFSMILFEVLYCLGAWLFYKRRIRSLFDLTTLIAPAVIYGWMQLWRKYGAVSLILLGAYIVFLFVRYEKKCRRMLRRAEDFMFDHAVKIMYVIIPVSVTAVSILLFFTEKELIISLDEYKEYFTHEPLRSYFFMDHNIVNFILDLFRWSGLVILMIQAKSDDEKQLRSMYLLFLILFLNPLSVGLMAKIMGQEVYACSFEVLFNPFTDLCLLVAIYRVSAWTPIGQWVLEILLVVSVVFAHVGSFASLPGGLYTDLVQEARAADTGS